MKARVVKKVTPDRAALLAMLTKVASNPVLLAYLTSKPYELLGEYHRLVKNEGLLLAHNHVLGP